MPPLTEDWDGVLKLDLADRDGMLDRDKVIAELDKILLDTLPPEARQDIIDLIDEATGRSFMDGMEF